MMSDQKQVPTNGYSLATVRIHIGYALDDAPPARVTAGEVRYLLDRVEQLEGQLVEARMLLLEKQKEVDLRKTELDVAKSQYANLKSLTDQATSLLNAAVKSRG